MTALSQIPHEGVVETMIKLLGDDDPVVVDWAWWRLVELTDSGIQCTETVQEDHERWWEEN